MKFQDVDIFGTLNMTGSFQIPYGYGTGSYPQNPLSGSLFLDTESDTVVVANDNGWEVVGAQTTPVPSIDIEYLLVAGGGGAAADSGGGPGGGAGGLLSSSLSSVTSGSSFTITIGGGGIGYDGSNPSVDGTDSTIAGATISTITAVGGGGAGSFVDTGTTYLGHDGGSGGGSGNGNASVSRPNGGSGTVGQGNDGGGALGVAVNNGNNAAGGGGGAGAAGVDAASGAGGNGGDGLQSSITGASTYYAGGGAGGTRGSGTAGTGGQGGGGNANNTTNGTGQDGSANTGGGAGGSRSTPTAAGGSGVAIFAYDSGSSNCAGGIVGDAGNGRKYHQFNTTGTLKVGSSSNFEVISDNLVLHLDAGHYNSRGTSTWSDLTSNGYDATLVSSPALGQNFYYDFDGSADYGTFASAAHTAISSHTQGTVEAWVNGDSFTSGTARKTIFGVGHTSSTNIWCVMRVTSTNYLQLSGNNSGTSFGCNVTSTLPSTSTWYHFTITYNGSSFAAYYDGVAQTINTSANGWFSTPSSNALQVGALDRGTSGNNYDPWDGKIAQVRVYNTALTAAQVLQNYEATKTNFI